MDWNGNGNGNGAVPFVSGPAESSFSFLFNYDLHYSVPIPAGTEMMHTMTMQTQEGVETVQIMEMNNCANNSNNNVEEKRRKKKKLTSEQLGSLESSFQEDIKLEPDRKMKLAQELDIDPRQVAVWFQNRRARWKAKQLERSYHSLKHQLHLVSKENQMLQDEVRGLRAVLNEESTKKQVESTYRYWGTASNNQNQGDHHHHHQRNFVFNNIDDNNQGGMMPYWGVMPSSP